MVTQATETQATGIDVSGSDKKIELLKKANELIAKANELKEQAQTLN